MIDTILITFRKLLTWDFFFSRLEVLIGEMLETDSESGAPIHDSKVKSEYGVKKYWEHSNLKYLHILLDCTI